MEAIGLLVTLEARRGNPVAGFTAQDDWSFGTQARTCTTAVIVGSAATVSFSRRPFHWLPCPERRT